MEQQQPEDTSELLKQGDELLESSRRLLADIDRALADGPSDETDTDGPADTPG